jgi:hypothetical protein
MVVLAFLVLLLKDFEQALKDIIEEKGIFKTLYVMQHSLF